MKRLVALLSFLTTLGRASTLTLQPSADTALFENFPTNNLGRVGQLPAGTTRLGERARMLLKFDLTSAIPSNAVISAVSVTVKVVSAPAEPNTNSVFDLRRMLVPWTEGVQSISQQGGPASLGEPTWLARAAPDTLWSSPGGAAPVDFAADPSGSTLIEGAGSYTFASTSNLVRDVQGWLRNPASNLGWMILTESEGTAKTARRFGSREFADNSPSLVVDYTSPPRLELVSIAAGTVNLSFTAQAHRSCLVEFKEALTAIDWQTLTNVAAQSTVQPVNIVVPVSQNASHFYRLLLP